MVSTEDRIKEETSISKEIRVMLARFPRQETRPLQVTSWGREVVEASRSNGISDKKTREWIRAYAREASWSEPQINAVLRDNELI
jgi:hypothetical protein